MKERLLVTGGTGFLGRHVVPLLQEKFEVDLISRSVEGALRGDLTRWNGGLPLDELKGRRYRAFVHLAGLYDLKASATDCFLHNVAGTSQALRICHLLEIPVILNASSVAAAVNSKLSTVRPYDLNFEVPFPDPYAESKAQGEQMLQNWTGSPLLRVNLRLGILVGDSRKGRIDRVDGPYYAPQALERIRGLIENSPTAFPFPGDEKTRLPLVPVDACARAVVRFVEWSLETKEEGYKSYHLTPSEGLPVREFYRSCLKHLHMRNNGFMLVSRLPQALVRKISKWTIRFPEEQLAYLLSLPRYDVSGAERVLGEKWCPEFADYERIFWNGYEEHVSHR